MKRPVVLARSRRLLAALLVAAPSAVGAATLQGVGDLPGGLVESEAYAISADGSTVVGRSESASGTEAFVWTAGGGLVGLGDLAGGEFFSQATAVSDDGTVVVGEGRDAAGGTAVRWTAPGGLQPLCAGQALDVSGDGAVVVGQADLRALRWTEASGCVLFDMDDAYGFEAVSSLGGVAAGRSRPAEALRWTEAGGFDLLGDLRTGPVESPISEAYGVSGGGAFVVGGARDDDGFDQVFRWDAVHGMVGLGVPPTAFAAGADVSWDGSVIVGPPGLGAGAGNEAFLWDAQHGLRKLEVALEQEHGLDLDGWQLAVASAVSDDGRVIAGWGTNPGGQREGYVVDLPEASGAGLALAVLLALRAASRAAATPSGPRRG